MSATVIAGYNSYGSKAIPVSLREVDDGFDSDNSEVDEKCDSDYSLSDIESGLDNVSLSSLSVRRSPISNDHHQLVDGEKARNSLKRLKKKRVDSNRSAKSKSPSFANDNPDEVLVRDSTKGETRTYDESSTCSEGSRSSNLSGSPSRRASRDYSSMTGTVKSLKRYKLAMEAYRKSAEKSLDDGESNEQKVDSSSSPVSGADRSSSEKSRVFDWNLSNSSDKPEKVSLNENNNVELEAFSDGKQCHGVNLNLDYRSLLRNTALKRKKLDGFDSNRASIDTDVITDIDIMVGITSNESTSESDRRQSSEYDLYSPRNSNDVSDFDQVDSYKSDPQSPEVIMWPEYNTYVKSKASSRQLGFKNRFATLSKERSQSALEAKSKSSFDLSVDDDYLPSCGTVNLRDKQLIKKRNFSSSNLCLASNHQPRPSVFTLPTSSRNEPSKFHTISSSTRLGKLLRRQQQRISAAGSPSDEIGPDKRFIHASSCDLPSSIDENGEEHNDTRHRSTLFVKNPHQSRSSSRKLCLSSTMSQSLPALRVITEGRQTNPMINVGPNSILRQLSHSDIIETDTTNEKRDFLTLTRRKFSTLRRKTTSAFSLKRRSLKPSDIIHTKLNTNNNDKDIDY